MTTIRNNIAWFEPFKTDHTNQAWLGNQPSHQKRSCNCFKNTKSPHIYIFVVRGFVPTRFVTTLDLCLPPSTFFEALAGDAFLAVVRERSLPEQPSTSKCFLHPVSPRSKSVPRSMSSWHNGHRSWFSSFIAAKKKVGGVRIELLSDRVRR
jgi:hypothetical protein